MKKSIGLLSALVVTSTFIVNCQKAPENRRVRPTPGSALAKINVVEKSAEPTKSCSSEISDSYQNFMMLYKKSASLNVTAEMSKVEIDELASDLNKMVVKCHELLPALRALGEAENFGCLSKESSTAQATKVTESNIKKQCFYIGHKLKEQHTKQDNVLTAMDAAEKKSATETQKIESDLLGKELLMSKNASTLILKNNINGAKFLANGVIESTTESMNKAKAANQSICTFIGKLDVDFKEGSEATLRIISTQKAEKNEIANLDSEFTGKATLIAAEVSQGDIKNESISLLCLNLDSEKLTVDTIKSALGSDITTAPVQVSTEVVDSSAKEEPTPAPAPASKVETQVPADLSELKMMAERFEAEAKEAEANVAKLESEKASAEAIQEAKGVAQLRRQSADEAKAKYDAAVEAAKKPALIEI